MERFRKDLTRKASFFFLAFLLSAIWLTPVSAIDYKDYRRTSQMDEYFEISVDQDQIKITLFEEDDETKYWYPRSSVKKSLDRVTIDNAITFSEKGMEIDDVLFRYEDVTDMLISGEDEDVRITFYKAKQESDRIARLRRGNFLEFDKSVIVDEDDFIRGYVFTINSDIEIYGEVNKDIVSLFGEVYVGPGGVARGDVATLTSRITVANDASIYGEVFSGKKQRSRGKHRYRFYHRRNLFDLDGDFDYNRVDGATLYLWTRYDDRDSVVPSLWAEGGYGFNSKRWRYAFGLEQVLWRERPLAIGGEMDRSLISYDDWLLSDHENMVFALLATEDFKDYYEAEGGTIYLRFEPFNFSRLDLAYRYEETKWLPANPELWSLFGGDKVFRDNYSTVDDDFRQSGIEEIDSTVNSLIKTSLSYDTRDKDAVFDYSSWYLNGELEWSHPDINSDFDYTRYNILAKRYQSLNRRIMLMITGAWGKSDGYLPMHRRYYLGGLGTLRGYYHKEFMGSAFWMTSLEYRIGFRRTDFATSVLWDVGQITENSGLTEDTEIRHNIGLAIYLDDDFKLSVSKRMDSSDRNDVKFYVRLTNVF